MPLEFASYDRLNYNFDWKQVLITALAAYAVVTGIFLISENRRPQATLAWLFAFLLMPGIGLVAYVLFGRNSKAFSKHSQLLRQDLEAHARPLLAQILSQQDAQIARLETRGLAYRKLMMLVRRNSHSALTTRNKVEIQQNADVFYENLINDIRSARQSVHLQYFIWRSDPFTEELRYCKKLWMSVVRRRLVGV